MKKFWLEKNECTGCGACANICPKQAIEMKVDECGFQYPYIDDKCIKCNLCENICRVRGEHAKVHANVPDTYAVWSKNKEIRYQSTSGGAYTELAKIVLRSGGCVVGAQYREDNLVEHVIVSEEEGLSRIRQSKYIQSETGTIYKDVKKKLEEGITVAFCGAPCQVAALYAYLGNKEYHNLITFDFICRGMNSPKAYRSWLNELEEIEGCKAVRVWFKYKEGGWKSSPKRTRIDFSDGHYVVKEQEENLFMHGYLTSNLYIRPSCGNCDFKGVPRQGDITLADFWGIETELDDDKGTSLVLVNSEKGKRIFEQAKTELYIHKRKFEEIFKGNVCFNSSVEVPEKGEAFLKVLDDMKFSKAIKKYTKVSFAKRLKRKAKQILK